MHVAGNQKQEWERAPSLDSINLKPALDMQQQEQKKDRVYICGTRGTKRDLNGGYGMSGRSLYNFCRDNDNNVRALVVVCILLSYKREIPNHLLSISFPATFFLLFNPSTFFSPLSTRFWTSSIYYYDCIIITTTTSTAAATNYITHIQCSNTATTATCPLRWKAISTWWGRQ